MTTNLKAIYERGVLRLKEPLPLPDGAHVDVTVVTHGEGHGKRSKQMDDHSWDALTQLLTDCAIDTGIPDFARKHDRYLYGTSAPDKGWRTMA